MASKNKSDYTIEEKRRKNVMDNQKFLKNLKLLNVRDDLKSSVNSITTLNKPKKRKQTQKPKIDSSEVRRSSRIQTMPLANYNNQASDDDLSENVVLSTDNSSSDEGDDLSSAFTATIDKDWEPSHIHKKSHTKKAPVLRQARKPMSGDVKIFLPNIGLQASKVVSKERSHRAHVSKKMYVAISSSEEED